MHEDWKTSPEKLAFAKQFLIAPSAFKTDKLKDWKIQPLNNGLGLYSHPELNITRVSKGNVSLCGLGLFLDPWAPGNDDYAILQHLVAACAGFFELEAALAKLAGRWLLAATIDRQTRIYPDATGQKPIFIHRSEKGVFAGSHPALLAHLGVVTRDADLKRRFEADTNSGSWPVKITPYREIEQVLPNHYLTLPEGRIVRYWPRAGLEPKAADDAESEMLFILRGTIAAAMRRRPCVISLSGGHDSRVNLAAAAPLWDQTRFFTFRRRHTPHHDISIPKKLRRRYSLMHGFLRVSEKKSTDPVMDRLHANVGYMYYDNAAKVVPALARFAGASLHLPGTLSKVNRCYYYADGDHPAELSGTDLAARAGFAGNALAQAGFAVWLSELPADLPINPLDLLYWEHRLGVWSATGLTFGDGVIDSVPPMNCRRFLEVGLSTPVADRKAPYLLIRKLIGTAKPELLDFRFNEDWVDDWHRFRAEKLPLPWRVKQALGWTR